MTRTKTRALANWPNNAVSVLDFGAVGDGVTDDTAAIQEAIDTVPAGAVVYFPPGTYAVSQTKGTYDYWGILVDRGDITLEGSGQAKIIRTAPDLTNYADCYPPLFIGKPDSDSDNDAIENINIINLGFEGSNQQHSVQGNSLTDKRTAIELKNTRDVKIIGCEFTKIDSSAITTQYPRSYNYVAGVEYNQTVNFNIKIADCTFDAVPHSEYGRALIHAINATGVIGLKVTNNTFFWCDDAMNGSTYFSGTNQKYTEKFTDNSGNDWNRSGRDWLIDGNYCINSSEHAFYISGLNVVISNNTVITNEPDICISDIKIRSNNTTCSGNTVVGAGISINEGARAVTVTGNTIDFIIPPTSPSWNGGGLSLNFASMESYYNNRPQLGPPQQVGPICISNNSVKYNAGPVPDGSDRSANPSIRVVGPNSQGFLPGDYLASSINITGNSFDGFNNGMYLVNAQVETGAVSGNSFTGIYDPETKAVGSNAAICVSKSGAGASVQCFAHVNYSGNSFIGFKHVVTTTNPSGSDADNDAYYARSFTANTFRYITEGFFDTGVRQSSVNLSSNTFATNCNLDVIEVDLKQNFWSFDNFLGSYSRNCFRYINGLPEIIDFEGNRTQLATTFTTPFDAAEVEALSKSYTVTNAKQGN